MRVLLTAFEPFDGRDVNASQLAVAQVGRRWADEGADAELVTRVLPVSFVGARRALRTAVAEVEPQLVVCVGEAAGRAAVGVERVALNLMDARIPDADGHRPTDRPVVEGAPTALLATLPVKVCAQAARDAGVAAEVSYSAGT